jgi:Tfp pilus assembly protein PilZ
MNQTQQRQYLRFDVKIDVQIEYDDTIQPGTTVNMSQGGALISTSPTVDFGKRIILEIILPGIKEKCRIPSIVRWSKEGEGIGIQFESLRAIEVWAINRLKNS